MLSISSALGEGLFLFYIRRCFLPLSDSAVDGQGECERGSSATTLPAHDSRPPLFKLEMSQTAIATGQPTSKRRAPIARRGWVRTPANETMQ